MKRFLCIILAVILCFGVGMTAVYFQAGSIDVWYPTLVKPAITPPNIVFPIVWTVIYFCMALSIAWVWSTKEASGKIEITLLFALQLMLNFLWSISFFYLCAPWLGFINIVLLDAVVLWYVGRVSGESAVAAWLFAPYLMWLGFATYLNGYIMVYN